jgi:hypothetical protein
MKNINSTEIAITAAAVFSIGTLAGCDYCLPLALALLIFTMTQRCLPSDNKRAQYESLTF